MRLRLPKPLHGWRAFAGEVGIIVLGVLIALGAQQVVEELQWRSEARATEAALEEEIMDGVEVATERIAVSTCLRTRIAELGNELARSRGEWRGDPMRLGGQTDANSGVLPPAYRAPRRYLRMDTWETAKNKGVLDHLPRGRVAAYSAIYTQLAHMQQLSDIERGEVPALAMLSYDGPLDAESRTHAIDSLAQLDSINSHLVLGARNLISAAEGLQLEYSPAQKKDVAAIIQRLRIVYGDCVTVNPATSESAIHGQR
jgi:hypothetical protein